MRLSPHEKKIDVALRQIWGPDPPAFTGAPMATTPLCTAEIILHELAHQTLMPDTMVFHPGVMSMRRPPYDFDAFKTVADWLGHLRPYQRDLHEIRAIAIELLAGKKLRLKLDEKNITSSGWRNSCIKWRAIQFKRGGENPGTSVDDFRVRVKKAAKTSRVIFAAETIYELVKMSMPKGRR